MFNRLFAPACIAVLALGCSDDDGVTPPDDDSYRIVGTVTDPGDLPVSRAFINIDYELLVDGARRPRTTVHYVVADETADVRIEILDGTGRLVRLLVDESQPGGTYEVSWDGRNDDGDIVPEGFYTSRTLVGGVLVSDTDLFFEPQSFLDRAATHLVLTDQNGRFSLYVDELDVGRVLDSVPGETAVLSVHTVIKLYAFRGGTTTHDFVTLDLGDVDADIDVDLVIPYGLVDGRITP